MENKIFTSNAKKRIQFASTCPVSVRQTFVKQADGTDKEITTLMGYPILWGATSSDRGGYKVRLAANSAKFAAPCMALFHHDFEKVLGTTANNTLRINSDSKGVSVEIDLPDTTTGRDVAELVAKKYVSGMSFSMSNGFEEYTESKEGDDDIVNCTAYTVDEFTVTPIPAFTETSIGVKASEDDSDESDEEEQHAEADRPGGMSKITKAKLKLATARLDSLTV